MTTQQNLFESLPGEKSQFQSDTNTLNKNSKGSKDAPVLDAKTTAERRNKPTLGMENVKNDNQFSSHGSKKTQSMKKSAIRKMQVSNGHYLNFDHLARLTNAIASREDASNIKMSDLEEDTGLPFRQVRNRVSIARALGLFKKNSLQFTELGSLVVKHDPFCESTATLEYLHYQAAGNYENLIWFEVFSSLLNRQEIMALPGWMNYFQESLSDQYTKRTLKKHLGEELRFIVDAYFKQNFRKLLLLHENEDGKIYRRRYTQFNPLMLCAMIYDFCLSQKTHLYQVEELSTTPGSPAMLFGLDTASLRQQIEGLHEKGWLRYETTHNLDQIR
ncbi:MAG: DUF4007 family protein, partial [Acidobacteriota bacterium]